MLQVFAIKSDDKTRKVINKNFLIRYKFQGDPKTYLVGAGQYKNIVGEQQALKHFERALTSGKDRLIIKVRAHLTITFVGK